MSARSHEILNKFNAQHKGEATVAALISFALFGLFVGSLCGLSSSPVTLTLMPLLFTFAGGSIFAFFGKMSAATRTAAYTALGAASFGGIIGTYAAILIASHQVLGPPRDLSEGAKGYLRSGSITQIELKLTQLEQSGRLSAETASQIRAELYKGQ